jgi:hypothetical protein
MKSFKNILKDYMSRKAQMFLKASRQCRIALNLSNLWSPTLGRDHHRENNLTCVSKRKIFSNLLFKGC